MVNPPTAGIDDEPIPAPDDDLCLAYVNTCYWRGSAAPTDELNGIEDLLRWVETIERLPPTMLRRLATHCRDTPEPIFRAAIRLRELIARCFAGAAARHAPAEGDLAALNAALADAPPRQRVRPGGWDVGAPEPSTAALLAPVL